MTRTFIIAALVAVTACGEVAPTQQERQVANAIENAQLDNAQMSQDRILALPEPQRLAVFANAIRDSGQDCQQVNSAESGGTYRDLPVWRATCRGGTVWTIVIGNVGIASVLNPNEAALIENEIGSAPANAQ